MPAAASERSQDDAPLLGVLALQGDFEDHAEAFAREGLRIRFVRTAKDLDGLDAIALPGGESTTMLKLLDVEGLWEPLGRALHSGMPVFATSLTIDPRANAIENLDLESVRFMEMPWFVQPDHPAVMAYTRPAEVMPIDFERLYALGIDAWRVTQVMLANQKAKSIPPLDGVTGRIALEGHQFVRQLAAGEIRDGRPTLFKPAE